jgi:hypothetical protein
MKEESSENNVPYFIINKYSLLSSKLNAMKIHGLTPYPISPQRLRPYLRLRESSDLCAAFTVKLNPDFCWILVGLNSFEALPAFCQLPYLRIGADCLLSRHRIQESLTVVTNENS